MTVDEAPCPTTDAAWTALLARHAAAWGRRDDVVAALPRTFVYSDDDGERTVSLTATQFRFDVTRGGVERSFGIDTRGPWLLGPSGVTTREYRTEAQDISLIPWVWRRDYLLPVRWTRLTCAKRGTRTIASATADLPKDGYPRIGVDVANAAVVEFGCGLADGGATMSSTTWTDTGRVRWPTTKSMTSRSGADVSVPPSIVEASWTGSTESSTLPLRVDTTLHFAATSAATTFSATFDSGSTATIVAIDSPLAAMVHQQGEARVWGPAHDDTQAAQGVLDEVTVGDLTLRHVPVAIMAKEGFSDDIVLGMVLVESAVLRIDYKAAKLTLQRPRKGLHDGMGRIDMSLIAGGLFAPVTLDGVRAAAAIDTGCAAPLVLSSRWVRDQGWGAPASVPIATATLGGLSFGPLGAAVVDLRLPPSSGEAALLGNPLLARCSPIVLDLPARTLWVDGACGAPSTQ